MRASLRCHSRSPCGDDVGASTGGPSRIGNRILGLLSERSALLLP